MPLATSLDKDAIREAYEDVRSDLTDTEWAVFKFDGAQIIVHERGQCFEEFRQQFGDSERAFGYIRIQMGDEMSKRKKFIFLTWIGQEVGVIQRAKMSTDKALIKDVLNVSATFFLSLSHESNSPVFLSLSLQNFAVELQAGVEAELDIELFREALNRAGGANYGTGIRDNWVESWGASLEDIRQVRQALRLLLHFLCATPFNCWPNSATFFFT